MDIPKPPAPIDDGAILSERRALAQRLHDDVCQILAAATYQAAILKKDLKTRSAVELDQAEEVYAAVREAAVKLRTLLDELQNPKA